MLSRTAPKAIIIGLAVLALLMFIIAPATAYNWHASPISDSNEIGDNPNPAEPAASTKTGFAGQNNIIAAGKTESYCDAIVTSKGGNSTAKMSMVDGRYGGTVVTEDAESNITGPAESHDHSNATTPMGNEQFTNSALVPTEQAYETGVMTTTGSEASMFQTGCKNLSSPADADDEQRGKVNSDVETLQDSITLLQVISGASALFAFGAFGAAIMAYRGTD